MWPAARDRGPKVPTRAQSTIPSRNLIGFVGPRHGKENRPESDTRV